MIGVFYPYLAAQKKWDELRYSLRSLETFFREEEYEVWIVGDLPEWAVNVRHIPHVKDERLADSATCDAISKLWAYLENEETPGQFIRMYDDIYFLAPRTLEDLKVTRYLYTWDEFKGKKLTSGCGTWQESVKASIDAVRALGYPGIMTETHCPEVFRKWKMQQIYGMFAPWDNRLLTSTLYYNVFPYKRMLKDFKTERALFYGVENMMSYCSINFKEAIEGKFFLNHNNAGLDGQLIRFIERMYPERSRFER